MSTKQTSMPPFNRSHCQPFVELEVLFIEENPLATVSFEGDRQRINVLDYTLLHIILFATNPTLDKHLGCPIIPGH